MKFGAITFALLAISLFQIGAGVKVLYNIKVSLVDQDKERALERLSGAQLEVNNVATASPLDFKVLTSRRQLVEYRQEEACDNCYFLIELSPADGGKRKFRSIVDFNYINGQSFEDFIEVYINEKNELNGFKYGIVDYGEPTRDTSIIEVQPKDPSQSPDVVAEIEQVMYKKAQTPEGRGPGGEVPEENKTFFQKYFWYIIIGGFVVFQFLTVDKNQLNQAMQQAQEQAGNRAGGKK
mmetsp:Transcript_104910/g.146268  ORF Transcript_104910/g.146268 Transcript_104910/m.146268 type:complete len:237 (+) Transcript_104910:53-763(+)